MNINSWQFLVFFPVIAVLYFAVTARVRKNADRTLVRSRLLLLAASLFFYMCWNPVYLCLILFSVAVTWTSGILMSDHGSLSQSTGRKKLILASSLALNLAVLFFFKYYNFFAGTMNSLFGRSGVAQWDCSCNYPLTDPAASPDTTCFCSKLYTMMLGSETSTIAANMAP